MPIEVQLPDGSIAEFPDGMSNAQIENVLQQQFGGNAPMPAAPDPTQPMMLGGQEVPPPPAPTVGIDSGPVNAAVHGFNRLIPFGNVMSSGLSAAGVKGSDLIGLTDTGLSYEDLYNQALENTERTMERNPKAALAGSLAGFGAQLPALSSRAIFGAAPTTGARGAVNAIPGALAKVGNFVRGGETAQGASALSRIGNAALRPVKSAAVAAPTGALYGAGEAAPGDRGRGAVEGAGMAAAVGAATPVALGALGAGAAGARNLARGATSRGVDSLDNAQSAMFDKAAASYEAMRKANAVFRPDAATNAIQSIDDAFSKEILLPEMHGKTLAIVQKMKDDIAQNGLGLEGLDQWRRVLSRVPRSADGAEDYRLARKAVGAIDDFVDNLSPADISKGGTEAAEALKNARSEWARATKFEKVADIVRKSDGDANYVKRELKKILDKKGGTRGFTADEVKALEDAAKLSGGEGVLKMLGRFGFDFNNRLGSGVAAGIGGLLAGQAAGPVVGTALPVLGTLARYGQKGITRGKAENLLKTIEGQQPQQRKMLETINPQQIEAPPLALPAPKSEVIVDRFGKTRLQAPKERDAAILSRQREQSLGLSSDIRNAVDKMMKGRAWDELEDAQRNQIAAQIDRAWREKKEPIGEVIRKAKTMAEELAEATGDEVPQTQMRDAFERAFRKSQ